MKLKTEETPWFDGSIKPVREGVYRRKFGKGKWFSLFKEGIWFAGGPTPFIAHRAPDIFSSFYQNLPWRGLAKDPKG